MYRLLQNDYEAVFTRIARNAILKISGDYNAPDYWLKRKTIGDAMKALLTEHMEQAQATVTGFMLLKIDLPDTYEDAIVQTEVTNQERQTFSQIRLANETQQKSKNIEIAAQARIKVINANATATAQEKTYNGSATVINQTFFYTADALKLVQDKLQFTTPQKSLLNYFLYQRLYYLKNNTDNKLFVGKQNVTTWQ